jgi:periplasmic divalent cation tolerance protein
MPAQNPTEAILILCTTPRGGGRAIAEKLVAEQLVACVNITPVTSCFRWKGEMTFEDEELLIAKSVQARGAEVQERIRALHPYEVPEILVLNVDGGATPYLDWVAESVRR